MAKTTIDTLVQDIYALFGSEEKFDMSLFHQFGDNLKDLMDARFHPKEERVPRLRMSNIGRPDRQLYYDINHAGEKEKLLPQTLIKFAYGDLIEQMILLYAKMAGHDVQMEQAEVEVDGIKGHIDALVDGVLLDVKSASSFSFQKFESGALFARGDDGKLTNDPFGYVAQLAGYVEAVNPGGRGGFLAVDKTLGKLCFCEVPRDVLNDFKVRERIAHIKDVIASPEVPERCYPDVPDGKSGNMKLGTGCSYCSHKFRCWADANDGEGLKTFYYSNGPRYLTRVVREPKVDSMPYSGGEFADYDT